MPCETVLAESFPPFWALTRLLPLLFLQFFSPLFCMNSSVVQHTLGDFGFFVLVVGWSCW